MEKKVCLHLNCYENTYVKFFKQRVHEYLSHFSDFNFSEKILTVSNISQNSFSEIDKSIKEIMHPLGFRDIYIKDEEDEVLEKFGLKTSDYQPSEIWYSLAKFIGIYYSHCDYLLYLDDNIDVSHAGGGDFIRRSIELLEEEDHYLLSMPSWEKDNKGAILEWLEDGQEDEKDFFVSSGFTDQIYLIKVEDVFKKIYDGTFHPDSARYPAYGGKSFERIIDTYMKYNRLFRMVDKNNYYIH
jgi:hypothetical protein